jgi:hypothetical protein
MRRLRERRRERLQRWQFGVLVVLAALVTAGAVVGAYELAQRLSHHASPVDARSGLVLVTIGAHEAGRRPVAALALYDNVQRGWLVFTVPRELLLQNSQGGYVMAGDVMGTPALAEDLARLVHSPVAYQVSLSSASLLRFAGGGPVNVELAGSATLLLGDTWRTYDGAFQIAPGEVPSLLSATGKSGADEDAMGQAVLASVLHAGALLPAQQRATTVKAVIGTAGSARSRLAAEQALTGLLQGKIAIERLPSTGVVSLGQFAFQPDESRIMSEITRRVPGYSARFTVLIQNGTGQLGIGGLVRQRLAVLNVNLPSPSNADSFDYKRTEILAGSEALAVAQDVRAILGLGVILQGQNLPSTTLLVIIGSDLKAKDLQ